MSLARQILLDSPVAFWPLDDGPWFAPGFGPEDITGVVAAWVADDIAQSNGSAVSSWTDRVSGKVLAQATGSKQPIYRTSGIASQPAVDFDGSDDLLRYAGQVSSASSGSVFVVHNFDSFGGGAVLWSASDEASTTHTLLSFLPNTQQRFDIEQNDGGGTTGGAQANNTITISTNYFFEWQSLDTSYQLRYNGTTAAKTVGAGNDNGNWFADTSGVDNFVIGGHKTTSESSPYDGKIALVVVLDGEISSADRNALYLWVQQKYGISLGMATADRSGNARVGTPRFGVTVNTPGPAGMPAYAFNGTSTAYVDVASSSAFASHAGSTGVWSFEAWLYRTTSGAEQVVMSRGTPSLWEIMVEVSSSNLIEVSMLTTGNAFVMHLHAGASVLNRWQHLAVTYNRATPLMVTYLDGVEAARTTSVTGSNVSGDSSGSLYLGTRFDSPGVFMWNGRLTQAAVFPSALSADRVKAHYEAGIRNGTAFG